MKGGLQGMYVLLAIVGLLLGAELGGRVAGGAVLGCLTGLIAAELLALRRRVAELEGHARDPQPKASLQSPVATGAPAAPVAVSHVPQAAPVPTVVAPLGGREGAALSPLARLLGQRLIALFTGGNAVARVGVLVLFFGVAFLLRYLAEHSHISMALRLVVVASGGGLLLLLGVVLARRRRGYGLALQAGGVAVIYLTAFVALSVFALLSAVLTLTALVALAILSAALAVAQGSQALAVMAVSGGLLAPLLTGFGVDRPVMLLSYYLVLNGSILWVGWHRSWRALNWVGFVLTVALVGWWGAQHYEARLFAVTELFLALFFLLYLAMVLVLAFRQPPGRAGHVDAVVDGGVVFGAPVAALSFQAGMLQDAPHALAASALLLSGIYGLLSWGMRRGRHPSQRLAECFSALAVMLLTAALPLATGGRHWAAMWALEGATLVWVGCRQQRPWRRAAGALLIVASGVLCLAMAQGAPQNPWPVWLSASTAPSTALAVDCVTLGFAAVFAAVMGAVTLRRHAAGPLSAGLHPYEAHGPALLFGWGLFWWLYGGLLAIQQHVPDPYPLAAGLLWVSATAVIAGEIGVRANLAPARVAALGLLPVLDLFALFTLIASEHPLASGGQLAWPLAFAAFYFLLARHEERSPREAVAVLHAAGALLLIALGTWESAYQLGFFTTGSVSASRGWPSLSWALLPAIVVAVLPALIERIAWPLKRHAATYRVWVGGSLAAYLAAWSVVSYCGLPRVTYPGTLLPVLKAVDLGEVGVLLALAAYLSYWASLSGPSPVPREKPAGSRGPVLLERLPERARWLLVILWLHVSLLRGLHFWGGVDYQLDALLASTLVQSALSIFWAGMALLVMVLATLRSSRRLWLWGAALLGAVIIKLFLIDLARIGTIERIVSFIGVGVLTLVIGYFAPDAPGAAAVPSGPGAPQEEPPRS